MSITRSAISSEPKSQVNATLSVERVSFFVPFPFIERDAEIRGGANKVVTSVIRITTPNICSSRIPAVRPIPAIIRATSPRGIIPQPILKAPFKLKPNPKAGSPQPTTFATTASKV